MNKVILKLFSLTIFSICLCSYAIHAQTSNLPPDSEEFHHFDPVVEAKERVKRFHEDLLFRQKISTNWFATNGKILSKQTTLKLIRPAGIDDEGWELEQLYLELILQENQPIEFYAHVLDQNGEPVVGARLELHLSGVDTDKVLAKFPHMNMGEEQIHWTNMMYSDLDGWIRLKGVAGHYLNIWSISKDGYLCLWQYPEGNHGGVSYEATMISETNGVSGGVHYEPRLERTPMQDILMTNSWNPQKGYILYLQKIGKTNSVNSVK